MPQQQRSEETRSRILRAALDCFSRAGYDASGVAEICTQAGVSKGAFYHHFQSKQAVFLELLDSWLAALDQRFEDVRAASTPVPQLLEAMAQAAGQSFSEASGQLPLFLEFYRQALRDPLLRERTLAPFQRYQQVFAGIVQAGIDEGSLHPVDPDSAARTLLALAVGLLVQAALLPGDNPQDESAAIQHLLRGLARPSP